MIAGLDVVALAFELIDPRVQLVVNHLDGTGVLPGDIIATVRGPARALLTAERTALNLLCHLSGIATLTVAVVEAVRDRKVKIVCTRKTTPGVRALEKYAVCAGGGSNHRFGLDDAMLIKDNHIAIAGIGEPPYKSLINNDNGGPGGSSFSIGNQYIGEWFANPFSSYSLVWSGEPNDDKRD